MHDENIKSQLLTAKELAELLGLSARTVFRLRSSRKLPTPVRIGGSIRWKLPDIQMFLDCDCDMDEYEARRCSSDE